MPDRGNLAQRIEAVVARRRLLQHPFYRRWENGELTLGDLRRYAEQYRHFEAAVPAVLGGILEGLDGSSDAADLVARNLADEEGPVPHLALFDGFAAALGADIATAAGPAMRRLLAAYDEAAPDPLDGLAALAAYEVQSAEVAASKAQGLRRHHALDGDATAFWDTHASVDVDHATWTMDALDAVADSPEREARAIQVAATVAERWWAFLDEQEAMLPVPA